jgi:hypothetical protein
MNIDDLKKKIVGSMPAPLWQAGGVVQAGKRTSVLVLFNGDHSSDGRLKLKDNPEDPIPGYAFMGNPASAAHPSACQLELDETGETFDIFLRNSDGRFVNQGPTVKK